MPCVRASIFKHCYFLLKILRLLHFSIDFGKRPEEHSFIAFASSAETFNGCKRNLNAEILKFSFMFESRIAYSFRSTAFFVFCNLSVFLLGFFTPFSISFFLRNLWNYARVFFLLNKKKRTKFPWKFPSRIASIYGKRWRQKLWRNMKPTETWTYHISEINSKNIWISIEGKL